MSDLISRAAVLEALGHFNDYVNGDPHFLNGIETAKEITENLPTIDAIPVEWLIDRANDPERAPLYRRYAKMLYEEWQKE